jgi:hypothetical protein
VTSHSVGFMPWLGRMLHAKFEQPILAPPFHAGRREADGDTLPYVYSTVPKGEPTNAERLVAAAMACLGENLSAGSGVPPNVACAISVNLVHYAAFGVEIGGGASTYDLYLVLGRHRDFRQVPGADAGPGSIVLCPTGYGKKSAYPHGHVGILCEHGICANCSLTGIWTESYPSVAAWKRQFEFIEGYPTYYFQRI